MYLANLDIDVVDLGVPVLSMHAPFEVVSKLDVYMAYRAFKVFAEGKIKKHNGALKFNSFTAPEKEYTYEGCFTACQKR